MNERLTDEQLAAIRARVDLVVKGRAREAEAREKMNQNMGSISALRTFRALQELCVEAEEDVYCNAGEDIPALLATIDALEAENDRLRSAESVSLALEDALNDGRLVKPAQDAAPDALDLENAILWIIQYMHIHEPDMLHRMFERAVRECYAVNTSRETEGELRAMLQVARDNAYLWPHEWDQLIDTYGPPEDDAE